MTPEQQARVMTELLDLREAARAEYFRYLRQYQALDLAIKLQLLPESPPDILSNGAEYKYCHIEIPRRHGKNTLRKIIMDEVVNKKRKKELDKKALHKKK
jgi:hypothetical protein